jgi:hypothetical protein
MIAFDKSGLMERLIRRWRQRNSPQRRGWGSVLRAAGCRQQAIAIGHQVLKAKSCQHGPIIFKRDELLHV